MRHLSQFSLKSVLILTLCALSAATYAADEPVDYARQIKPLLKQRCFACHGALQQKSGLRLDTVAAMKRGGDGGPVIEPGTPADSLLLEVISGADGPRMPPKGEATPLSPEEVALIRRWIAQGADGPKDEQPEIDPHDYWSYQVPQRPALPVAKNSHWVRTPVDAFIAAKHDELGLHPRPEAPREVWLRRVTLDLIGLPPTREELHRFLADEAPDAYERVVDGLLERPQYGERWGRHWMDIWRYSDWYGSRGINEIRYSQRHIWRWRDWIVESLNADKPYDRMIVEMLAGDEVAPTDPNTLRATGFIGRNWYKFDRNVWMFDAVEHTAQAFLGLTLKCARCHDHKYDPIPQEDYYRFRAFFEPHDVRTDRLAADTPTEKDATLGQVLKDGVARVYDKQADAETYVFQRGDNRYPDKDRPVLPGVPAALGNSRVEPQTVALPPEAFYPALQPVVLEGLIAQAQAGVSKAQQEVERARRDAEAATKKRDELAARTAHDGAASQPGADNRPPPVFHDDFSKPRPDVWKAHSGEWVYENGKLVQKTIGSFATFVSSVAHPRDFQARWKYRPLEAGSLRSIGFSFDYIDQGNSQDVYTHVNDQSQGIQAFHRQNGSQVYPAAGIVKTAGLKVGEPAVVEIEVRGDRLTIRLNGEKQLDYVLPVPRRNGRFAIWAHQGTVEFEELTIRELVPTPAELEQQQQQAHDAIALAERKLLTAQAEVDSIRARAAAEQARYANDPPETTKPLNRAAARAERAVAVAKAADAVLQAEQTLVRTRAAEPSGTAGAAPSPALADAEKKLTEAQQALAAAQTALENAEETYAPLGEKYPETSTGRRLALANWIASPLNPRTARIAVNHIWLRHFGQALVPTVDNFGLNGLSPSNPELLDWLAVELVENGWHMKPIHRLIVLSSSYRLVSTLGDDTVAQREVDPENRYLWHANSRRMEAEVVRDSVLAAAGRLDLTLGGPEIPEADGQTVLRRSLYFRNTPNEKMKFLETFDVADPNQCYRRRESVVPQQALALMNSALALDQSRRLAASLTASTGEPGTDAGDRAFISAAYESLLTRSPTSEETAACVRFLQRHAEVVQAAEKTAFPAGQESKQPPADDPRQRARENLLHVLFSHNDFVTIR
jgi:mono/diheme cytochrome c family protein